MTVMYWLVAAAVFVVIEIMTMGLTTIWFATLPRATGPYSSDSDKTMGLEVC